jgi:predicted nucleotidyltransferase component of viral defense system
MPDLSEFVAFICERSGVKKPSLVEKDVLIHRILREMNKAFGDAYLFKGGSCLVKCYFGYYRFSVDLDFTWREQKVWRELGKKMLRRKLVAEAEKLASFLEDVAKRMELDFRAELKNTNYIEFGSGSRMATFKLWKGSELIKVQVNFVERLLFPHRELTARTLVDGAEIGKNDKLYFEEFLKFYSPVRVCAYSLEEILCEKIRAILTRQAMKLRDFYDVFMIERSGVRIEGLRGEVLRKIREVMRFKKYREALKASAKSLEIEEVLDDPFEMEMFVVKPDAEFYSFVRRFEKFLVGMAESVMEK